MIYSKLPPKGRIGGSFPWYTTASIEAPSRRILSKEQPEDGGEVADKEEVSGARLRKPTVAIISQREYTNMSDAQRRVGPCDLRRKQAESQPVKWILEGSIVSSTQKVEKYRCDGGTRLDNVWLTGSKAMVKRASHGLEHHAITFILVHTGIITNRQE